MNIHPEVLLAAGSALLLLGAALGVSALGRRARAGEDAWPRGEAARLPHGLAVLLVLVALAATAVGRRTWTDWRTGSSARSGD